MYAYITGTLEEVDRLSFYVVVEANGIGYRINVPGSVIENLPSRGETVKLYTYLHIREDVQALYGFLDREELNFFEKLITVSGVGPKVALGMLSVSSAHELAAAVITGDRKALSRAPGVGKKTAERIILELRDKIDKDAIKLADASAAEDSAPMDSKGFRGRSRAGVRLEALQALQALGYHAAEAEKALSGLDGADAAELIRQALRKLDNQP
ncbi:MAG: Holliday junction branch migration protein RuvA [Caldicoprobacterales bacterium]|jgi:Holliday junction DNA helicase RuvA|nr:Holliday junction branch migration protein RuvA [Clostridiales bacterium]